MITFCVSVTHQRIVKGSCYICKTEYVDTHTHICAYCSDTHIYKDIQYILWNGNPILPIGKLVFCKSFHLPFDLESERLWEYIGTTYVAILSEVAMFSKISNNTRYLEF